MILNLKWNFGNTLF